VPLVPYNYLKKNYAKINDALTPNTKSKTPQ